MRQARMTAAKRSNLDLRNQRRRDRYAFAKNLGFTGKEAILMCKWSEERIKAALKGKVN